MLNVKRYCLVITLSLFSFIVNAKQNNTSALCVGLDKHGVIDQYYINRTADWNDWHYTKPIGQIKFQPEGPLYSAQLKALIEKDEKGELAWDDNHLWAIVVTSGKNEKALFLQRLQYIEPKVDIVSHKQGAYLKVLLHQPEEYDDSGSVINVTLEYEIHLLEDKNINACQRIKRVTQQNSKQ